MPEFSQKTKDTFKDFQRLKRKKILERIGTVVGNVAEGVSSGAQGRAPKFRSMPDESGTYMTPMQKAAASQPLIEGMEQREQFYFTSALKDAQMRFQEQQQNMRSVLQAATQHESTTQRAASAGAALETQRLEHEIGRNHRDQQTILQPKEDTIAAVDALVSGSGIQDPEVAVAQLAKAQQRELLSGALTREVANVQQEQLRAQLAEAVPAQKQQLLIQAQGMLEDMEPGQASHAFDMLQEKAGISDAEMEAYGGGLHIGVQELQRQSLEQMETLETEATELETRYATETRRTFGDSAQVAAASDALAAGAQRQQLGGAQGAPQEVAGGAQVSEVAAQPQGAGGGGMAPQQQGATGTSEMGQYYYGDPNFGEVSGDAKQRTEDILNLIEQYPESPPLQEAKSALLAAPDFIKFKQTRGYPDDNIAFREMRHELRQAQQKQRQVSRENVRKNTDKGTRPDQFSVQSRLKKLVKPSSTPVQGAVSKVPVEAKQEE